jgi:hypothetical protein
MVAGEVLSSGWKLGTMAPADDAKKITMDCHHRLRQVSVIPEPISQSPEP